MKRDSLPNDHAQFSAWNGFRDPCIFLGGALGAGIMNGGLRVREWKRGVWGCFWTIYVQMKLSMKGTSTVDSSSS